MGLGPALAWKSRKAVSGMDMEAASASAVCLGPALARNSGATSAPTGVILGTEAGSAAVGKVVASTSEALSTNAGAGSGANLAGTFGRRGLRWSWRWSRSCALNEHIFRQRG